MLGQLATDARTLHAKTLGVCQVNLSLESLQSTGLDGIRRASTAPYTPNNSGMQIMASLERLPVIYVQRFPVWVWAAQEAQVDAPDCRSNLNRLVSGAVVWRSVSLRCRSRVADRAGWHRELRGGMP